MKVSPLTSRARKLRQTQTVAEKILWQRLRKNQLNGWGFRRQAPVADFVVDFLCHAPALILEVDGPVHDDPEQQCFDAERTKVLESEGFIVVPVREADVRNCLEQIEAWLTNVGEAVLAGRRLSGEERRFVYRPLP